MKRFGGIVKDSKRSLKVRIKPVDIEDAVCKDHQQCVIAKAIKRQTGARWVDVGASVVLVGLDKDHAQRYLIPALAKEQVKYFDEHNGAFAPCTVELMKPWTGYNQGLKARKLGERVGEAVGVPDTRRGRPRRRCKPSR